MRNFGRWMAAATAIAATLCAGGANAPAADLKVTALTFNLRFSKAHDGDNSWDHRRDQVRDLIRRNAPDFLGAQEALPDQIAYLRDALPAYGHLARSREVDPSDGEAVPLFYLQERWKLDAAEHGTFWLSDTPEVPGSRSWGNYCPRVATWGRFEEKTTGRAVYVFNVHLDHLANYARTRSAALLAQRIAGRTHPDPVILMGDFNCGASSACIRSLTDDGAKLKLNDTFAALHPDAKDIGTFHGFGGSTSGAKIDYILTLPGPRVLDARILHDNCEGRYPSDHFPVIATVSLPEAKAKTNDTQ
jgi:endonuclease/exonuclease/phosphatase family metal-dependent hydrolase